MDPGGSRRWRRGWQSSSNPLSGADFPLYPAELAVLRIRSLFGSDPKPPLQDPIMNGHFWTQIQELNPGLGIRPIFGRIRLRIRILQIRILKLDPDPGSYWHLKNQFKHLNFVHIKHISSDILMMIIFIWKNGKIHLKMCKTKRIKPYIEERTLRTTRVFRQIGHSAWHFRRNFASPPPTKHLCACMYCVSPTETNHRK